MHRTVAIVLGLASPLAAAQLSDIDPTRAFAWSENTGYVNFNALPTGPDALRVLPSQSVALHLGGFAWQENTGWINLGDGDPADGVAYANTDGSDFGVNIDAAGNLFGLAWSENTGWINFDTRPTLTPTSQQARIDFTDRRFRGYAWSPTVGWINLDDADLFVQLRCPADLSSPALPGVADGVLTGADFFQFLTLFQAGDLSADFSSPTQPGVPDGVLSGADFFEFLSLFAQGC